MKFIGHLWIVLIFVFMACSPDQQVQQQSAELALDPKIEKWVDVFQPSVLTREQRIKELRWFKESAQDLRGVTVRSVAENIESHFYESRVLARAFEDITGIKVIHHVIPEGHLVPLVVDQMENGVRHYDIFVNDADLIGYHLRTKAVVNLTEYMGGEGKKYTNPYLDLNDFLNLEFGQIGRASCRERV